MSLPDAGEGDRSLVTMLLSSCAMHGVFIGALGKLEILGYVLLIVVVTAVVALLVHLLLRKRYERPATSEHVWRDAILGALDAPLLTIVWLIGLTAAVDVFILRGGRFPLLVKVFPPTRDVAAIAAVTWFLIRMIDRVMGNYQAQARARNKELDETSTDAIGKVATAVVVIVAALMAMQTLGFPIASLLTFGGIAGIALGFAAQGLVANLLGGISIYASRPFRVGDHIILPDTNLMGKAAYIGWQAGEVQHIGWRATRILDWNGKPFYVPNAKFNTQTIINHSRMSFREISQTVYVRLEDIDKVSAIVADVNRMLKEHPAMGDYLVFRFSGYGDYALELYLYAYTVATATAYTEYMRIKEDVLLGIAEIIARHGAKLAVPVSTVYLPKDSTPGGDTDGRNRPRVSPGAIEM